MKTITTQAELKVEIALLEIKHANNAIALREQFELMYESLRPINLIKSTVEDLTSSPDFRGHLINSTIGLGAGYLTKKVIVGATHNPIKQILGTLLQVGITSIVAKNGDGIVLGAMNWLGQVFSKKNKKHE